MSNINKFFARLQQIETEAQSQNKTPPSQIAIVFAAYILEVIDKAQINLPDSMSCEADGGIALYFSGFGWGRLIVDSQGNIVASYSRPNTENIVLRVVQNEAAILDIIAIIRTKIGVE